MNRDGVSDLVVGSLEDVGSGSGSIWIIFLNSDGSVKSQREITDGISGFDGNFSGTERFGSAVENLGDLDKDGVVDIMVGAPGSDIGGFNHGAAWVLFLNQDGTVKSSQEISDNSGNFSATLGNNATFGTDISRIGDLNNDGVTDVAVSSFADTGKGAVWILFLNDDGMVQSYQKITDSVGGFNTTLDVGDRFGSSVSGVGDLDGDSITDIAVGSIWDDDGGENRGAVWISFSKSNELENEYPLYTQVESIYPSLVETSDWEDGSYAYGLPGWCGDTIGGCGCAITSGVMAGRNAGITTDVVGTAVNPKNINDYLRTVGGYTSDGSVYWLAMQAYLGEITDDGRLASRFKYIAKHEGAGTMAAVDDYLTRDNEYAVLAFKNSFGHFVWLPEKTDDSYVVRDPFWYLTNTANDTTAAQVKDYNNTFDSVRVFEVLDEPVVASGSGIEAYLKGTAELVYKNTVGNIVGYQNGSVVINVPNSSYGNAEVIGLNGTPSPQAGGKHLLVSEAGNEFTIDVIGTGTGEFEMEFFTISETGEVTTFSFSGQTLPGVTSTFVFDLETGEVVEKPLSYEQFLSILNTQLGGYSDQQKDFFMKWAQKMYSDMENKTVAQALQSISVYKKLLTAKKVESPVLTSVLGLLEGGVKKR